MHVHNYLCLCTLCFYRLDEIDVWVDEDEFPMSTYAELLHGSTQASALVGWILIFVQFLCFKYGISDAITGLLLGFFKTVYGLRKI